MKILKAISLIILTITTATAYAGPGEITRIQSPTMGIGIENEGKKLVVVLETNYDRELHTVIDLDRAGDLAYKTRIMRYFGGMLKNDTYKFESIQVISEDQNFEMEFTRANVSTIINSILANVES